MAITLEQIKLDIKEGRSTCIYYSAHTLWWTHLDADVKEATQQGVEQRDKDYAKLMLDPNVPDERKKTFEAAMKQIKQSVEDTGHQVPLDPTGSPLLMTERPNGWIEKAERKPQHFGRHGIDTFVKAHHQNCGALVFSTWKQYDVLMDVN